MFIWITSKNIPGTIISFAAATIATVMVQYSMNAARELNLSGKGAIILIIITVAIILGGIIMAELSAHEKRR